MKKLNRVIGGGAVAIAIMLMASAMDSGMARAAQPNMLRAKEIMACKSKTPVMKLMEGKDMSSQIKVR